MNKKVAIFSDVNPTKSYSCIQYLADTLSENGIAVDLYAKIPSKDMKYTKFWKFNVQSIYNFAYGKLPFIRRYLAQVHLFILSVFFYENIIIHELTFFRIARMAKKINKKLTVIHYATELYDENDEPNHKALLDFYRANSSLPDLVIECNEQRSELRRELFNVKSKTVVIENTIPLVDRSSNPKKDCMLVDEPIKLIYTGAAYLHRELDRIIDAFSMSNLGKNVQLVLVCYGGDEDIRQLQEYCERNISDHYTMHANLSRDEALEHVANSDIGIVYYRPSLSMGNRLAAPTKFYEYLSLGLPVVCSNNDSLIPIIDTYNIGAYVDDESISSLSNAIKDVYYGIKKGDFDKISIKNIFKDNLEYKVKSKDSIETIIDLLG
ncbi:glycosyltransferase [Vibrio alginolyticus]|uniref:glycosyltransferase n=1 Tax=Vibrio alginolyticus TaxID=663 RepID=UPI00215BF921|nr:glycosyltransferase [Vibrio alginolyticus]MCR9389657.1 glycosyltransferase [Vibrio alginolyticus]